MGKRERTSTKQFFGIMTKTIKPLSKGEIKEAENLIAQARANRFYLPGFEALYLAELMDRAKACGQHQSHWPTTRK